MRFQVDWKCGITTEPTIQVFEFVSPSFLISKMRTALNYGTPIKRTYTYILMWSEAGKNSVHRYACSYMCRARQIGGKFQKRNWIARCIFYTHKQPNNGALLLNKDKYLHAIIIIRKRNTTNPAAKKLKHWRDNFEMVHSRKMKKTNGMKHKKKIEKVLNGNV